MAYDPRLTHIGRRALLVAPAALSLGLIHGSPQLGAARQGSPTPTLLVRGETTLNGADMAWRVVHDVADASPEATFERRALGFAVAASAFISLLLTDQATGSACRLAPGDAAFVGDGTVQRRESLGSRAQSYLRIGLVVASAAANAGGDRMEFAGPPFEAPIGPVTLALHRVALAAGETAGLGPSAGEGETLVLVEQGEVELEIGEAAPRQRLITTVGSDTNYAIRSVGAAAMLYGARDATSVLVATIQ